MGRPLCVRALLWVLLAARAWAENCPVCEETMAHLRASTERGRADADVLRVLAARAAARNIRRLAQGMAGPRAARRNQP